MVIFGAARVGRGRQIVYGDYITAAHWFTSSTRFANPAVVAVIIYVPRTDT